ncbi:TPA: hypothetical protein L7U36_005120 [Klebsiella pneumoniae]|nr:hypothetical protein HJX30_26680 [Klebsiella pneumoniae]HBQ2685756.1 hypothetical protein [Klebsiella pneumoniae]
MSLEVARCRIEAWRIHYNQRRPGDDSNLLVMIYHQIMPDNFVIQFHRFRERQ